MTLWTWPEKGFPDMRRVWNLVCLWQGLTGLRWPLSSLLEVQIRLLSAGPSEIRSVPSDVVTLTQRVSWLIMTNQWPRLASADRRTADTAGWPVHERWARAVISGQSVRTSRQSAGSGVPGQMRVGLHSHLLLNTVRCLRSAHRFDQTDKQIHVRVLVYICTHARARLSA